MDERRGVVQGARPARQARSRDASVRIARAARVLLEQSRFEELSVARIAEHAGTSVGGLYARFPNKATLLQAVNAEVLDEIRDAFDHRMDGLKAGSSVADVVRAYVSEMVRQFSRHRHVILEIRRHAAAADAGGYRERLQAFNAHVHERLRAEIRVRREDVGSEDLEFAMNFALFMVSAAAREAVLAGSLSAYPIEVDEKRLVEELTRAFVARLESPPPRGP